MKRACLLRVELLEDRCVPAVDTTTAVLEPVVIAPTESYVIDPPLIDPNTVPTPPPPDSSNTTPSEYTPLPSDLIIPIPVPFWY